MAKETEDQQKVVATNRKAYHDYFIEEKFEAGVVLKGTEVKSLRDRRVNLQDSYASVKDGEVFLHHCHISPYSHGNIMNHPVDWKKTYSGIPNTCLVHPRNARLRRLQSRPSLELQSSGSQSAPSQA